MPGKSMIRCEKGHFYDSSFYSSCPYCTSGKGSYSPPTDAAPALVNRGGLEDERTISQFAAEGDGNLTETIGGDWESTMAFFPAEKGPWQEGLNPVVGWLVCTEGPEKGRDYRLHAGRNQIGRSNKMAVTPVEDESISRENHASIVYDPKSNSFYIAPGESAATYLNGANVTDAMPLVEGCELSLGKSKFAFVAYCKGEVKWS